MSAPCYLVEWYRPDLADDLVARLDQFATAAHEAGTQVTLLMALAVPADEVVFGLFAADSVDAVTRVCGQAGLPAQRVTEADPPLIRRETPDLSRSTPQ